MSRGGWGGFSVPGHSGTQFKHRQAFGKRQYGVRKAQRTSGKTVSTELERRKEWSPFWLWSIRVVVFALGILLVWGMIIVYRQFTQPVMTNAKTQVEAKTFQTASEYETLLEMAEGELAAGQYERAIEDFERILEYNPQHEGALQGVTEARQLIND